MAEIRSAGDHVVKREEGRDMYRDVACGIGREGMTSNTGIGSKG